MSEINSLRVLLRAADAPARRVAVAALLALLGCAGPSGSRPGPDCAPDFPYTGGWLGGDAAYSVALPPDASGTTRTLWLFGDSFVGDPGARDRIGASFVHNSIAISRCTRRGFALDYHWGRGAAGEPRAFLDPEANDPEARARQTSGPADNQWWWLFDGFVHEGALYVGLLELRASPPRSALALPFRPVGMKLARIANPADPPTQWQVEVSVLSTSEAAFPGAAMRVHGDHVYLFSFAALRGSSQPRFLARLPLTALSPFPRDLTRSLETFTGSRLAEGWERGFRPQRARLLMNDAATEMSVEYHPLLERWVTIYASPIDAPGEIRFRTAQRLEGPWSAPALLHRMQELEPTAQGAATGTFCYAAKGHRAFAAPGYWFATYVCNLNPVGRERPIAALRRLQTDMEVYRPRSVTVPVPAALTGPAASEAAR